MMNRFRKKVAVPRVPADTLLNRNLPMLPAASPSLLAICLV